MEKNYFFCILLILTICVRNFAQNNDLEKIPPEKQKLIKVECGKDWYDSGGPAGSYNSNENINYTFIPEYHCRVRLYFIKFKTQIRKDILTIVNNGVHQPLSGAPTVPFTVLSSDPKGKLIAKFISNSSINYAGWEAKVQCLCPPNHIIIRHDKKYVYLGDKITVEFESKEGGWCDGVNDYWEYKWMLKSHDEDIVIKDWSKQSKVTFFPSTYGEARIYTLMRCHANPAGVSEPSNTVTVKVYRLINNVCDSSNIPLIDKSTIKKFFIERK